ncbi:Calcineurin-like phosphoesterase domain, ApaH type [Dillenia turbinata]|uniref:Purple acid phosphatase n=1 Tax=Dillenia turbinata TaxID=194707 RepID=A0AAN8ZKM9_9MAGN
MQKGKPLITGSTLLKVLLAVVNAKIPTTLDGPFKPVTVLFDACLRGHASSEESEKDSRLNRSPFLSLPLTILFGSPGSLFSFFFGVFMLNFGLIDILNSAGEYQIGFNITALNPETVSSVVQYGTMEHLLSHKVTGYSPVYSQLYPFEGLRNYTSGIIHHVRLTGDNCGICVATAGRVNSNIQLSHRYKLAQKLGYVYVGLKPSTVHYYKCGDPSLQAMSSIHHFKTMPISGPQNYPNRIAIAGDLGLTYNTTATISHVISNEPDLMLLIGDVTYANQYLTNGTGADCYSCAFSDSPIHETYQPRWDYWGRFMEGLVSKVPIMVVQGNHEIELEAENQSFVAYSSRFAFSSEESGSSSTMYYSFNAGGIHFIMLGAYIGYNKTGIYHLLLFVNIFYQYTVMAILLLPRWGLARFKKKKIKTNSDSSSKHGEMDVSPKGSRASSSRKAKIAATKSGHKPNDDSKVDGKTKDDNSKTRSNRVYNHTLDPCGPVHITIGDGGNREKMAIPHADEPGECPEPSSTPDSHMPGFCARNFTSGPAAGKFCWDRQPEYSALERVKNETWAVWTWHRNQDPYKEIGDQIYIVRTPESSPIHPKDVYLD